MNNHCPHKIILNSFNHYRVVNLSTGIKIIEYGDMCPAMTDREPYREEEGTIIATINYGETVEFFYRTEDSKRLIACTTIRPTTFQDHTYCGDDIRYPIIDQSLKDKNK